MWRVRWAAIGAAIAVSVGGGGVFIANAVTPTASVVVPVDPVRILDTRDPVNLGLPGPLVSAVSQKLPVAGTAAVPVGATGVLLNVTAVEASAAGFLSIRPGDATGAPTTSSLNFKAGDIVPNSVQVALPTTGANVGEIDITYDAFGQRGPTTDVLIDVVGYMVVRGGGSGPAGPAGTPGATLPRDRPAPPERQGSRGRQGCRVLPDRMDYSHPWIDSRSTQIVQGAILTCVTTSVGLVDVTCTGMKLNGLDVQVGIRA